MVNHAFQILIAWCIHQGHDGFPNDRAFLTGNSLNAIVWDGDTSRMIEHNCDDLVTEAVRKVGANNYQFRLPWFRDNIKIGNMITVRPLLDTLLQVLCWLCTQPLHAFWHAQARGSDSCSAVSFERCQWCTLSGMTIHSASCFGFYEANCTGTTYRYALLGSTLQSTRCHKRAGRTLR